LNRSVHAGTNQFNDGKYGYWLQRLDDREDARGCALKDLP
jgi:hypothetical protein